MVSPASSFILNVPLSVMAWFGGERAGGVTEAGGGVGETGTLGEGGSKERRARTETETRLYDYSSNVP